MSIRQYVIDFSGNPVQPHKQAALTSFWHLGSSWSCQKLEHVQEETKKISFFCKDFSKMIFPGCTKPMLLRDQESWGPTVLKNFKDLPPTLGQTAIIYHGMNNRTAVVCMMEHGLQLSRL